jgi:SsrA-binding protein
MAKDERPLKLVAENRRARHDYFIEDDLEAGIVLEGSEVKSLRTGKANIAESYAAVEGGELWLINGYIPAYAQAKSFGHDERRRRKLRLYFNEKGRAKLQLGIAKGKKLADKRATAAKRDWQRQKARLLRERG